MSICRKCGGDGPFYAGDPNNCQECLKAGVRAYRAANLEMVRAKDRQRGFLPHRIAKVKAYAATKPEALKRGHKAWAKRNPEKRKAQAILWREIRAGRIIKPTGCQKCGKEGRIEAHHPDYSKPLDVLWLCYEHHRMEHRPTETL